MLGLSIKTESAHADRYINTCLQGILCFRPIILKRLNSSELVVQAIVYLVKGRQMLQEYLANRYDNPTLLATCKVLGYLTQI